VDRALEQSKILGRLGAPGRRVVENVAFDWIPRNEVCEELSRCSAHFDDAQTGGKGHVAFDDVEDLVVGVVRSALHFDR
jgi:hypothetical protein